jgi:CYTH domain-containing protein
MPTEHELKFVLDVDCEKVIAKESTRTKTLSQGYLCLSKGMAVRVRETVDGTDIKYEMCVKTRVKSGRCVEVETPIDIRDFNDLWEITVNRVEKVRYIIGTKKKEIWEVDFFKDHHQKTYFAMAEHEMPENQLTPNNMPSIIRKHLIFEVPLLDDRFSSKRLADVKHAKKLLSTILEKTNEGR